MATYYAYSEIRHDGGVIKVGEKVDQSTIGVSDEEWQNFLDTNVVGEEPYPEDLASGESLAKYNVRKAQEGLEAAQAGEVGKSTPKSALSKKADESTSSKS